MKRLMKKVTNNEGFTLIELMIVLSIIAILAVVLVPRVGEMKVSVREQGVSANVNSVRAFLELKVNDRESTVASERDELVDNFTDEFTEGNLIKNPFTSGTDIATWDLGVEDADYSVVVEDDNDDIDGASGDARYNTTSDDDRIGKVAVVVCTDGYIVFGFDSTGTPLPYYTVK